MQVAQSITAPTATEAWPDTPAQDRSRWSIDLDSKTMYEANTEQMSAISKPSASAGLVTEH